MKKLIAISVVLVLLATAVFAQPSVGGSLGARVTIIEGDSGENVDGNAKPLVGGFTFKNRHVNVTYANGDGTAGGLVRLYAAPANGWWVDGPAPIPFAFGWWKPIPQLRIQIGHNADGDGGAQQLSGWGYNAEAQDNVAVDQDGNIWTGWPPNVGGAPAARMARIGGAWWGGFGELGAYVSIFPMDGLTINLSLPFGNGRDEGITKNVGTIYSKIGANVVYNIPDIGTVRISWQGTGGLADTEEYPQEASPGSIYASFYLTAVDGLGVDIGFAFGIPYQTHKYDGAGEVDVSPGAKIGLGVRYVAGDFGIRARIGVDNLGAKNVAVSGNNFGASVASSVVGEDTPIMLGFGILPYYTVAGVRIVLNAGLGIVLPNKDMADAKIDPFIDWFVNPYIIKSVSAFTFYAGFALGADNQLTVDGKSPTDSDVKIRWSIPVGFNAYF